MPGGEGGAESAILHTDLDGDRPAQAFTASGDLREKVAKEKSEEMQEEHRKEKNTRSGRDRISVQRDDTTDNGDNDQRADQWPERVDTRPEFRSILHCS